jgi:uncharacterized protein
VRDPAITEDDMDFILYCIDKPGRADTRRSVRAAHLEYVSPRQNVFRYGGPLTGDDGRVYGSLMILNLPDRVALDRHMRGDPYFSADLFESVTIWTSRQVVPEATAGALQAELVEQRRAAQQAG